MKAWRIGLAIKRVKVQATMRTPAFDRIQRLKSEELYSTECGLVAGGIIYRDAEFNMNSQSFGGLAGQTGSQENNKAALSAWNPAWRAIATKNR